MNPIILIAMFGRRRLVEINLRLLAEQKCQIVVVASLQEDFAFLRSLKIPHLQIVPAPNNPLGAKWQVGVEQCRVLKADPLIILGSDDYLSADFVSRACQLSTAFDFVCFNTWSIYEAQTGKAYQLTYNKKMANGGRFPLGSGRSYSGRFLDRKYWQLFDPSLNRLLDDFSWNSVKAPDVILFNPAGMSLLAIKGNWEQFNPLDKILSSPNITWERVKIEDLDKVFNFKESIKQTFKL